MGIARGRAEIDLANDAAFGIKKRFACNAAVQHIDHAAYSVAAIEQGARATQNLYSLYAQRVGGNSMVIAQAGYISDRAAVTQNAHAVTIEPANDGATGVRAEIGTGHTRSAVQRFANRGL